MIIDFVKIYRICFLISLVGVGTTLSGQKIKLKKNKILVDKVHKYDFLKTKKGGLKGISNFLLKNLNGDEILEISDTIIYFDQLPNDESPRAALHVPVLKSKSLNKSCLIEEIISLNIRKAVIKSLIDHGFFKSDKLNSAIFDELCAAYNSSKVLSFTNSLDTLNELRVLNYSETEAKFGPLKRRAPSIVNCYQGVIKEGKSVLGKFIMDKKGSYAHTYKVQNAEGFIIASYSIILGENRCNVRAIADESRKWFYYKKPITLDARMTNAAKHLVDLGYL